MPRARTSARQLRAQIEEEMDALRERGAELRERFEERVRERGGRLARTTPGAAGFLGGLLVGAVAWSQLMDRSRNGLFSRQPVRRFAAVSYLGARPSVDTVRLLRDYVRWEPHPLLRRRARRVLAAV